MGGKSSGRKSFGDAAKLDGVRPQIEQLLETGASALDVARKFDVSRNAVIGWAARRKVKLAANVGGHPPTAGHRRKSRHGGAWSTLPSEVSKPRVTKIPSLTSPDFPIPYRWLGIPFEKAKVGVCRRPLWGDDKTSGNVCGLEVKEGSSYCEECHARFYTTPPKPVREGHRPTNSRLSSYKQLDFVG